MAYDLVIRNGTVVDGSGQQPYHADIGVVGDRIASIGRIRDRGKDNIDADGQIVAPGFIECHSHMDAQVFWDSLGTCPAWHGVTTTIMGNCGFTLAPCRETEVDLCFRSLERAEDISRTALLAGIKWRWETYAEYLDVVESLPKGINYAGYVGHSALRSYVMGQRSFESEANSDEIAAMCRELESALKAGAVGLSTSRTSSHKTSDDKPVASRLASWDEVRALAKVMTKLGTGLIEIAPDQTGGPDMRAKNQTVLGEIAIESGRPVTFFSTHFPPQGDAWIEMMKLVENTAERGGRMILQAHPRHIQTILGFRAQLPFDQLPSWMPMRALPLAEQRAALCDSGIRAKLVAEAMNGPYGHDSVGGEARPPDWKIMGVLESPLGPNRSVGEMASERGVTPADLMIDLSLDSDMKQLFVQPYANHDLNEVLTMLKMPRAVVGGSDSGAHVSQILDSSITTFLLAHWVRREQAFTWEEAIRKLTFDIALGWGLRGRGLVAEGYVADLVVFDPLRVGPDMPEVDHDLPGGAKRLKQRATGMTASIVAGQVVLANGEHSGALPGRLLRGPLAANRDATLN